MSSDLLRSVQEQQLKAEAPDLRPGDDVQVHFRIVEGGRERIQLVRGTVMRVKRGTVSASFTVRRIAAHGIGVERTFPLHSPRIEMVDVLRHAHVRREKLYFLRGRLGKSVRLKEKRLIQQ